MYLTKQTNGNIVTIHTIDITSFNLSCGNYETLVVFQNENEHTHISNDPRLASI